MGYDISIVGTDFDANRKNQAHNFKPHPHTFHFSHCCLCSLTCLSLSSHTYIHTYLHAEVTQSYKKTTTTPKAMNHIDSSSFTLNHQEIAKQGNDDKRLMSASSAAAVAVAVAASSPATPPQLCCNSRNHNISPNDTSVIHFPCLPPKIPRSSSILGGASPFELLIDDHQHQHQNNFTTTMNHATGPTISPLKADEYACESRHYCYYSGEVDRHSSDILSASSCHSRRPPVPTEIRIPTTTSAATREQELLEGKSSSSHDDNQSWISNIYYNHSNCNVSPGHHQHEEDYKTLYFCSQRDMHQLEQRNANVLEENRLLKRQLFEMQRQLYSYRRNTAPVVVVVTSNTTNNTSSTSQQQQHKRRKISSSNAAAAVDATAAAPWSVPPSNLPQRSSRQVNEHRQPPSQQGGGGRARNLFQQQQQQQGGAGAAIRFRRVSVEQQQQGPAAHHVALQHLALPRLAHAISHEEGETTTTVLVHANKSG
jgi:hypothetical protein